jgi:Cyclin, N-terminal domain
MCTAQVLFHRYYYRKSFKQIDVHLVAPAVLFLAAKIEESPRRTRTFVNVFHHLKQRRGNQTSTPLDIHEKVCSKLCILRNVHAVCVYVCVCVCVTGVLFAVLFRALCFCVLFSSMSVSSCMFVANYCVNVWR